MSLDSWLGLTPEQFREAYQQFEKRKHSDFDAQDLADWRRSRWQVWRSMCPPDKKTLSQFDLIELPGDEKIKEQIEAAAKAKAKKRTPRDEKRFRYLAQKWMPKKK